MEQTRIPPQVGKYKVFIIDEVHMLSTAAFNAFLKTLEEPPAHVIFILATTEKHKILPTIISRCQIYDFERMTVRNIVDHLKMVAGKEGITYDDEALAVIAEKADGGMRDALSIFDQAVSFCQGNITYEKVIEDLNVLDSENYFRIVDLSLKNQVADIMVLLNTVINNGFDGGHLIGGLAAHLRNVLMARDEMTLPLLEVSERQREKYREQAKRCKAPFVYEALKLCNQCDINYRQSSNKRLLVELTLIQIAQLTQEEDTPAAGRSPKRLKSLFHKMMGVQQKAASQGAAERQQQPARPVAPQQGAQPVATPPAAKTPSARPALKLSNIGSTFANMRKTPEKTQYTREEEPRETGEQQPFDDDQLLLQWMSMCNRMPQQMAGLAARMKNMTPHIEQFPNVVVAVDNQLLLDQMKSIKNKVRNTLVRDLHNSSITLELRVARTEEMARALTRRELFDEMRKKNAALDRLCQALDLELA